MGDEKAMVTWMGRDLNYLSRDELIEIVHRLGRENSELRQTVIPQFGAPPELAHRTFKMDGRLFEGPNFWAGNNWPVNK